MENLKINGVEKQFDKLPETLTQLLNQLDINEATIVAEINGEIIAREKFAQTKLSAGQNIELIRFIGGG